MKKLSNKFIIVIPVYNVENLIEPAIRSVIAQKFDDVGIIIRDDMSTDKTADIIQNMVQLDGITSTYTKYLGRDVIFIRNHKKYYGTGNTHDSVMNYVDNPEAIVGTLDGDDMLIDIYALAKIYQVYIEKKVWLVWSQHQPISQISQGIPGCSAPLPADDTIYSTRNYWSVSHFRTFKAWLFDHIDKKDLSDPFENRPYCKFAGDASFTYALTEMCSNEKSYFLDEILYLYNDNLPLNDHVIALQNQQKYASYLRNSQRKYRKLLSQVSV